MAQKISMDLELRFIDNTTGGAKSASKAIDQIGKEAKEAGQEVDKLSKKKAEPKVDTDTSKVDRKLNKLDSVLKKLGFRRTKTTIDADDKATAKITRALNKVKGWAGKKFHAFLELKDSNALRTLEKMSNGLRSLVSKTVRIPVKILDYATRPLRALKNTLFSIKGLVAAITAGFAAKQLIINPINVADAYSSAKISFSTLLGESQGQQMMDNLDQFAKDTPFNTTNVISNAQKMLAMGWDAENIIDDMEVIGNAAAATGKLDQGLESIVRAMSQIKTKGRLSTEELNQLAEAGIAAKAMLAEQLGYGTGDSGIAKMTEDLEDGLISSDVAIQALLAGMRKYDGMMDSMANETVEGLGHQIKDAFNINVVRKWGQGLQDGAKRGFGTIVDLLDKSEGALAEFGDMLYDIGYKVSNWVADKFQNAVNRILEITDTFEFKNASLGEKFKMLWKGVITDPLREWWEGGGREKTVQTAGEIGSWLGKTITNGLLAIFSITDILDDENASKLGEEGGMNIAQSFAKGFKDNFDGSAITKAFVDAICDVWNALPSWGKILIGGYGIGKAAGGLANLASGLSSFAGGFKNVMGSFDILDYYTVGTGGTGLLNILGKAGAGLGATTSTGAILAGGAGIAGGLAAGASIIKGGMDLYRGYTTDNKVEAKASKVSGYTTLGGVATGAAIGTMFGPLGTLIGAGIGGLVGWFAGNKQADNIRAAVYESEEMKAALKDSEMSAEELAQTLAKAKWENANKHFGDIKLSLSEIERLADQIVWGDDITYYEKFSTAVKAAEANLQTLKSAADNTERWMWKAGLGVKFSEDEIESIVASFDEYINSAKSFVENKHYEFTAAVSLLVDIESEGGKSIIESGNAYYIGLQEQLDSIGSQLSSTITIALEDGVITLDEEAEIANLQQQIANITNKMANAEQKAELQLIKLKFGQGNLDYESFETFMSEMQNTINERMAANDEAYIAQVSSLEMRLADGAISQKEYDEQLQTILDGYNSTNTTLKAEISEVELQIIGEAYADVLGEDAIANLNDALQYSINNGLDPVTITDEQMANLLDIKLDGNGETISNIKDMLSGVFSQIDQIPAEVNVEPSIRVIYPIDASTLSEEFGIPESQSLTIYEELTGQKEIMNIITVSPDDFGIPDSVDTTIKFNITGLPNYLTGNSSFTGGLPYFANGQGFRGGIFGGSSSMDSFYRGGIAGYSDGGMVRGGAQLIKVAEEGSPEMIIPLSNQRRDRALQLWEKAGQMLKVPGFARGGRTDGGDEGIRFLGNQYNGTSGGQTVQVDVGGVKVEIHVNADGSTNVVEAVKAQLGEITDAVVGAIADELGALFENTPVRGGAA